MTATKRDWASAHEKIAKEGQCRVCKETPVDPAHLIARSKVEPGVGETASNIVPLCRKHHREFDDGDLDLLPYLRREEQATAVFLAGGIELARNRLRGYGKSRTDAISE